MNLPKPPNMIENREEMTEETDRNKMEIGRN